MIIYDSICMQRLAGVRTYFPQDTFLFLNDLISVSSQRWSFYICPDLGSSQRDNDY